MVQIITKMGPRIILKNKKNCKDGFQFFLSQGRKSKTLYICKNHSNILAFFLSKFFSNDSYDDRKAKLSIFLKDHSNISAKKN